MRLPRLDEFSQAAPDGIAPIGRWDIAHPPAGQVKAENVVGQRPSQPVTEIERLTLDVDQDKLRQDGFQLDRIDGLAPRQFSATMLVLPVLDEEAEAALVAARQIERHGPDRVRYPQNFRRRHVSV